MTSISATSPPPSGMIAPLPNCFSIAAMADETAFIFSLSFSFIVDDVDMEAPFGFGSLVRIERRSRLDRAVEQPVLQRLGQVRGPHRRRLIQVGDGAGHAPHAADRARRQPQPLDRALEQAVAAVVQRRDLLQLARGDAGTGPRAARPLPLARALDA